ncbi:DUF1176 domain-containing protein [Gloeothece verrucosa]|uniref:Uncharacterized protein n=1 Tax=Gloeothece verrucosa (strain PCC 7822) TaxID=497965 RepID=E0U7Y2_GLOV7|nr:DUF1176 domain-containing protein [Gloeothece verrucosa]ADN16069.1 hypothetical protein Cyan7822_4151 [Gloeothece verrucosa PCC 7822]
MFNFQKSFLILVLLLILPSCSNKEGLKKDSSLLNYSDQSDKELIEAQKSNPKLLQEVNKALKKVNACDGQIDVSVSEQNSSIYPINKKQYLVEFLCFLGAYQGNYEYYLYENLASKPNIKPLSLPVFEVDQAGQVTRSDSRSIGGIPDYNSVQQTLTVVTKYRGLGDCGSLAKYKWQQKEFKILEYRVKASCDGKYLEPEQYSRVYP